MNISEYQGLLEDYDDTIKSIKEQMEDAETIEEWLDLEHRLMQCRADRAKLLEHAKAEGVYLI